MGKSRSLGGEHGEECVERLDAAFDFNEDVATDILNDAGKCEACRKSHGHTA